MRRVICSACRRLPKEQQQCALWTDEVLGFLKQSNISKKNIKRLREAAPIIRHHICIE